MDGDGGASACGAMTVWGIAFASVSLAAPVNAKFHERSGCADLSSTVCAAGSESCARNCSWAEVVSAGGSAPTDRGAFGLGASASSEAVWLVPASGSHCGAIEIRALASAPVSPGTLRFTLRMSRPMAVVLLSEWALLGLMGTGAAGWDAGPFWSAPTAAAGDSGEGNATRCVDSGKLSIATAMLLSAGGTAAVALGSATGSL